MNYGLVTDFYQLTMAQGLWRIGAHNVPCVFDRSYRTNPFHGGYTVVAGLAHLVDFIEHFRYGEDEIEYLRSYGFEEAFLQWLRTFRFEGHIYAMPEGSVAFPGEVLLRVEAPKVQALLIETGLTMIMNHESLIATKARRVRTAAGQDPVMEFGLRRAPGESAGHYGARAAIIGGCDSTSNVEAARRFGLQAVGTMAHSWVMSFAEEIEAFREYARQYDHLILLADTYDTLHSGVPNAIRVFRELEREGKLPQRYGIRLDSGDLAYLSREARRMFDEAGFPNATITASNDLDEYLIRSLKGQGAAIDAWGVGTKLIAADGASALGGVYKLAAQKEDDKWIPKMKFSDNPEKITNPGRKEVYRFYRKEDDKMIADLVCLAGEEIHPEEAYELRSHLYRWQRRKLEPGRYRVQRMLEPIYQNGKLVYDVPVLPEIVAYANRQIAHLSDEYMRFDNPEIMEVHLSGALQQLKEDVIAMQMKK